MSAVARGLNGERRVWRALEEAGYLYASRRHVGGAGDCLAVEKGTRLFDKGRVRADLLIEVKTDKRSPTATFSPADRKALIDTAEEYGCEPLLAWTPYPSCIFWIPAEDWPQTPTRKETSHVSK